MKAAFGIHMSTRDSTTSDSNESSSTNDMNTILTTAYTHMLYPTMVQTAPTRSNRRHYWYLHIDCSQPISQTNVTTLHFRCSALRIVLGHWWRTFWTPQQWHCTTNSASNALSITESIRNVTMSWISKHSTAFDLLTEHSPGIREPRGDGVYGVERQWDTINISKTRADTSREASPVIQSCVQVCSGSGQSDFGDVRGTRSSTSAFVYVASWFVFRHKLQLLLATVLSIGRVLHPQQIEAYLPATIWIKENFAHFIS
jgi:hypothetical protein